MAIENLDGTVRGILATQGIGQAGDSKSKVVTVEVTSAASVNSTYFSQRLRIPSNARILGSGIIYFDDLASTGSPTLDIGLFGVDDNITDDDDALNDGIDVFTGASSSPIVKNISNYGKRAWEFVSGLTEDPRSQLDIRVTLKDAAANTGGTITIELHYTID